MKTAITAIATTLALATGAAAMVGPYERAVSQNASGPLFTEGTADYVPAPRSSSPEAEWTYGDEKKITVFSTKGSNTKADHFGVNGR
ncbi:hypothetical protein [Marimonas lutisalis]|uniref:hypothetical protein n=1 Tax=Marimonas lutisalis TaxID=2545756 RepID=UPI0010F5458F|nr:hypothetical protein [Marimonas lutisalis]